MHAALTSSPNLPQSVSRPKLWGHLLMFQMSICLSQKFCPASYSSSSSFSSLQEPRGVLTAHQPQTLAPQVALPCQVGKQRCAMTLVTTYDRRYRFLRSWVAQLLNGEPGLLVLYSTPRRQSASVVHICKVPSGMGKTHAFTASPAGWWKEEHPIFLNVHLVCTCCGSTSLRTRWCWRSRVSLW